MRCTQHLEKNDIEKLKEYCHCDTGRKHIMADIYGTQNLLMLENGLSDPENEKTSMLNLTVFKLYGKTLHKSFTTDSKNGDQIFS